MAPLFVVLKRHFQLTLQEIALLVQKPNIIGLKERDCEVDSLAVIHQTELRLEYLELLSDFVRVEVRISPVE